MNSVDPSRKWISRSVLGQPETVVVGLSALCLEICGQKNMQKWSTSFYDADNYDVWREELKCQGLNWSLEKKADPDFCASLRILPLSRVAIYDCDIGCFGSHRSAQDIKRSTHAVYDLVMIKRGALLTEHDDINTKVLPGQFLLWDTEKECRMKVEKETSYQAIEIPKDVVHSLTRHNPLRPQIIDGKSGFGAIFNACMSTAIANAQDFIDDEPSRFEEILLELMSKAFYQNTTTRPKSAKEKTFQRLKTYIDEHFSDPDLSPLKVANDLNLSVRYLHLFFNAEKTTFNKYLYNARLSAIKRELNGRPASDVSLTQLAHHFGFKDSSHFSRVFKRETGMTPSSYRREKNW